MKHVSSTLRINFTAALLIACFLFTQTLSYSQATWTVVSSQSPDSSGSLMLLLSDRSVLCKTTNGGDRVGTVWDKLTPVNGSYINGTWSRACPMANSRLYFSSQTFKNGNIYIAGGEYGDGSDLGEIYDPLTNTWTQLPNTNNFLGDANSAILENNKILQASLSGSNKVLIFDPQTNSYSNGPSTLGPHEEATWLKLPDKSILFLETGSTNSERYIPSLNQWIADATVSSNLYDPYGFETGPGFLLPDGRAFFMGSLGNTAFYTPSGTNSPGSWANGPTVPGNNGMPDAAGAMMVDGKIIFCAGPKPVGTNSLFLAPTYYYEFDYLTNAYTQLSAPGGGLSILDTAFSSVMLNLPDGNIMLSRQSTKDYYIHHPTGAPLAVGKPTITSIAQQPCSGTFTLTGLLFNGICEGASYGDDWQMNTNFPIVRLTSGSNIYYARTHHWNRVGVATGTLADTTLFDLPQNLPNGTYSLVVVANGNSSDPITFTFSPFPSLTSPLFAPDICSGNTFSYNAAANLNTTSFAWTRAAVAGIANPAITSSQSSNPNEILINNSNLAKTVIYSYTLTNGSCTADYKVSVVVHLTQIISIAGNTIVCDNVPTLLTARGVTNCLWNTGATTNMIIINPSITSSYSITGYDIYGCLSSQQFTVIVKPSPIVSLSGQTLICIGESATITASSTVGNYNWSNGIKTNSIFVTPTANTTYSISSIAPNGCSTKTNVTVNVELCESLKETQNTNMLFFLYPNPAQDELILKTTLKEEVKCIIYIYDCFGREVKKQESNFDKGDGQLAIDLRSLSEGVYTCSIISNKNIFRTSIVKVNEK